MFWVVLYSVITVSCLPAASKVLESVVCEQMSINWWFYCINDKISKVYWHCKIAKLKDIKSNQLFHFSHNIYSKMCEKVIQRRKIMQKNKQNNVSISFQLRQHPKAGWNTQHCTEQCFYIFFPVYVRDWRVTLMER